MIDISPLNESQRAAVTAGDGPMLVIAGAGSGKTRTIVYRLAWLATRSEDVRSMLLLTFTRKAAAEMKQRAAALLGAADISDGGRFFVHGGTFHSYAYSVLRRYPPAWAEGGLSIMDSADSTAAIQECRQEGGIGKGDRSFPHTPALLGLFSKARNKEMKIGDLLSREAQHLLPYAEDMERLSLLYAGYKRRHFLLDYDDLLFELEQLLLDRPDVLELARGTFSQIMVDEYQDTNMVQARIVRLLAGERGNVMVVGDDAQSIYAFRGATVRNILDFPNLFPGARIIRLEENYRSVQPILDVANALLDNSSEGYSKHLFSRRPAGGRTPVVLHRPLSDRTQAVLAADRIGQLMADGVPAGEIAVLFRSGYQSYQLEMELGRRGITFRKYGGLRYAEAAHIKDVMAFVRLIGNPMDILSFERVSALSRGIGPKTAKKLFGLASSGDAEAFKKAARRWPDFIDNMKLVAEMREERLSPKDALERVRERYQPKMEELFPEDWPRRAQGLDTLAGMAAEYDDIQTFVAEVFLDRPEEEEGAECVTLSTVHSAKGLEWSAVLVIDLVEDRFPSRFAMVRPEDFEEERRLMYVACTRAKDTLDLFSPENIYSKISGMPEPASPSPFISELPSGLCAEAWEKRGGFGLRAVRPATLFCGALAPEASAVVRGSGPDGEGKEECKDVFERKRDPRKLGFCRHRLFGRGKIVEEIPPDRYRVNFPGLGLKVIMADYLTLE